MMKDKEGQVQEEMKIRENLFERENRSEKRDQETGDKKSER